MEPTGRSAGCAGGAAGAAGAAGSATAAPQRPSAPTKFSDATGPRGLRRTFWSSAVALAQLGLANRSMGLEKKPPSLLSWKIWAEFLQPATPKASPAAHKMSAILETARQRKMISPGAVYPLVP